MRVAREDHVENRNLRWYDKAKTYVIANTLVALLAIGIVYFADELGIRKYVNGLVFFLVLIYIVIAVFYKRNVGK